MGGAGGVTPSLFGRDRGDMVGCGRRAAMHRVDD